MRRLLLLTAAASFATCVNAQNFDDCAIALTAAAYNTTIEDLEAAANAHEQSHACRGTNRSSGTSIGFNVGAYGATFGQQKQNSSIDCNNRGAASNSTSAEYRYAQIAVSDAYQSFIACKELAAQKVRATFKLLPSAVGIDVTRITDNAILRRVVVSPENTMSCSVHKDGQNLDAASALPIALDNSDTVNVVCKRTNVATDGGQSYPDSDVIVDTSRGSARLHLKGTIYPPTVSTDQLNARIAALEAQVLQNRNDADATLLRLTNYAKAWDLVSSARPVTKGKAERRDRVFATQCPPKHFAVGNNIELRNTIPSEGIRFTYTRCVQIPQWETVPAPVSPTAPTTATSSG